MICPKCRHDVGNQSVCPYCGATIFKQNAVQPHLPHRIGPVNGTKDGDEVRALLNVCQKLDTKLNLVLVISGANILLIVLLLIALACG